MAKKKKIKVFRWVYVIGSIVIAGSVMAFGSIQFVSIGLNASEPILMIGMILPMTLIYYLAIWPVINRLSKRIEILIDAMEHVSNGNLGFQIEMKRPGEFEDAYKQFNAMSLELKKTKAEMEDFTNEFAHEFKTPITAISGFADYLVETGEGIESEERMEQLIMISEESKRLLNLSMNTLLLSKVEALQVVADKERYDLAEQLRKCVILLSKQLDKKDIDIDMDEDLKLIYYGNEELLQHVWINLLNNAIKFTPQNGRITIQAIDNTKETVVTIADSGVGMDEKTMEKIFDKYYQNDSISVARGSGIGLSIVKRIVTLCGGTINVASTVGAGTTFTICLPNDNRIETDKMKTVGD